MGGSDLKVKHAKSKTSEDSAWRRIFLEAVRTRTSDIHIEPQDSALVVRFRQSGQLTTASSLAIESARPLIRELKRRAKLDLKQTKAPQAGSFSEVYDHHTYVLAVDTMPIVSGERLVIHIHDPLAQPLELKALGLWGNGLTHVQNGLATSHGLILISGPNHSGVSTSLASCALSLSSPVHQVASVEERTAYKLPGVDYMTVNPTSGMTWARALKRQLKTAQVVVVGNVPDRATAETAVKAAHTQQLIVGGVRADTTLAALMQLLRLSGNSTELAVSLRLAWNQRLISRLCPDCRESYIPDAALQNLLSYKFHLDSSFNLTRLQQLEAEAISQFDSDLSPAASKPSTTDTGITLLWRAKVGGCGSCHHTGYTGATALFEIVAISDNLRDRLAASTNIKDINMALLASRITSLAVDGLVKALCGLIEIDSVLGL